MTETPPAVPGELIEALRVDVYADIGLATGWDDSIDELVDCKADLTEAILRRLAAAVFGDIVEAARRDALDQAIEVVRALDPDNEGNGYGAGIDTAVEALTELRRGQEVT